MVLISRFRIKIALLILLHPVVGWSQESGEFKKEDVLRHVREALRQYHRLDLQAKVHHQFQTEDGKNGESTILLKVKRLNSRALLSWKQIAEQPGGEQAGFQKDFIIYDNGDVLDCQARIDSSFTQIPGKRGLGFGLHSQRLAGTQTIDQRSAYFGLNDLGAALWVVGYQPLLDLLDGATEIGVVPVNGAAEIHAKGEYGRLTLKVSSSNGWLPQSFELIKDPTHKTVGGRVADVFDNSVSSVTWTGEVKGFQIDSEGHQVPTEMLVERQTHWKSKPIQTESCTFAFEKVAFNPPLQDSDFKTDIVLPSGNPVMIMGATHLPYKWDGQSVVPGVPNKPIRPAKIAYENLAKSGRTLRTQTILIALNVVALPLAYIVLLWRRRMVSR